MYFCNVYKHLTVYMNGNIGCMNNFPWVCCVWTLWELDAYVCFAWLLQVGHWIQRKGSLAHRWRKAQIQILLWKKTKSKVGPDTSIINSSISLQFLSGCIKCKAWYLNCHISRKTGDPFDALSQKFYFYQLVSMQTLTIL